jgi:hypothetical protein
MSKNFSIIYVENQKFQSPQLIWKFRNDAENVQKHSIINFGLFGAIHFFKNVPP